MRSGLSTIGLVLLVAALYVAQLCGSVEAAEAQFYNKNGRKGCRFTLEIARTAGELTRGLMFRDSLAPDRGMLFIFQSDEVRNFWMLNTRIPLDMIFIHSSLQVVDVYHQAKPMDTTTISSKAPARYVLEVNAGQAARCSIQKGTKVKFTDFPGL
jgi:uncharacterized protein